MFDLPPELSKWNQIIEWTEIIIGTNNLAKVPPWPFALRVKEWHFINPVSACMQLLFSENRYVRCASPTRLQSRNKGNQSPQHTEINIGTNNLAKVPWSFLPTVKNDMSSMLRRHACKRKVHESQNTP